MTSKRRHRLPLALGLFCVVVVLASAGASASVPGSWNFASRIPAGATVPAARAGDLTLYLHNDDGSLLGGVNENGSGQMSLSELAGGQALVAWTAPLPTGGQELVGAARSDVAAVNALFSDGTTVLLELDSLNAFSNTNQDVPLVDLQALDASGATVGEITIPPTGPACGQTACRVLATRTGATNTSPPLYGLFSVPGRVGAGVASFGGKMTISRVNPTTLAPIGKSLKLPNYFWAQALSPDGTHLLGSTNQNGLSIIDLSHLSENAKVQARLAADLGTQTVRAAAWPAADRVLVLAQRMSQPYQRDVASRTLLGIDPASGAIVWKRTLSNKLRLIAAQTAGGKLVLQFGDSSLRRSAEKLVIASVGGQLSSSTVDIPKIKGRFQAATLVTTTGSSPAAYLVSANGTVFSIDLGNAQTAPHQVKAPANAPTSAPSSFSDIPSAAPFGENIVASGLFTRTSGIPRIGIYLIDTRTWTARLVDPKADRYVTGDKRLITFTSAPFSAIVTGHLVKGTGTGIAIYDQNGARVGHLYGERKFMAVGITPSFAYAFALTPKTTISKRPIPPFPLTGVRLLFDPTTVKSLGRTAHGTITSPRLISPGTPLTNG